MSKSFQGKRWPLECRWEGKRDERWNDWCAIDILDWMGDFCTPTDLAQWLKAASTAREWSRNAVASGEAQADPPGLSYSEATPE